jgi:hypothetical protein
LDIVAGDALRGRAQFITIDHSRVLAAPCMLTHPVAPLELSQHGMLPQEH